MRLKSLLRWTLSGGFLLAGVVFLAIFAVNFLGLGVGATATNESDPSGFSVPSVERPVSESGGPKDKTLKVSIPAMSRIENDTVPDAEGGDEQALKGNAAIHLRGTGFPWQQESNTYLAGHRLGYPGTDSFLAFYDLNKLESGDKVFVEDASGTKYTYEVYKSFVTGPSDLSVTEPVAGKNVVTLQTCTLPNYRDRLIVRAELVEKTPR